MTEWAVEVRQLPAADRRSASVQDLRVGVRREEQADRHEAGQAGRDLAVDDGAAAPLKGEIPGYPREQFLSDVCDEVETDIRKCFAAGAVRVSIDFTEGRLANKSHSRNPWIGKNMLQEFIDVNNPCGDGAGGAAARGRRGGQAPWQTGPAAGDE